MLEIKNVTKIYKTKGGVDTKALDGVSITFGETGLVFLLGKSGSGKSTLLNIAGGLDAPSSGEVTVKGKSSKDFSDSDFDSYRNTYVGFIFQEYNILDEFNVEDNIALALELQGKPKDKAKIADILQQVDLEAFARRKPNTLSGGQKQRIAIARALVKDPQIIMADEPTGALDSATGKQVFETLKKLSQTRLVIVVSHDREFAEIYGDRIVELKDGKIISDVSKCRAEPKKLSEAISVIGENTLSIKRGSNLTEENLEAIRAFISEAGSDVIISKGEREVGAFKRVNRMSEDGGVDVFEKTDAGNGTVKNYSADDAKFIRSHLPLGKAVKIGASSLKLKPVRLFFTIFLSFIAFTMFGLMSTLMMYDGNRVMASSYASSDNNYINLSKNYAYSYTYLDGKPYYGYGSACVTPGEVEGLAEKCGGAYGYFSPGDYHIANIYLNEAYSRSDYYNPKISALAYADGKAAEKLKLDGVYPSSYDEICISSYLLEVMKNSSVGVIEEKDGKLENSVATFTVKSAEDILGKYIMYNSEYRKVTGVFDCGSIPAKFDKLKFGSAEEEKLEAEFSSFMEEGMCYFAFISDEYFNECKVLKAPYFNSCQNSLFVTYKDFQILNFGTLSGESSAMLNGYVAAYGNSLQLPAHFVTKKNSLAYNEMLLPLTSLGDEMLLGEIRLKFLNEEKLKNPSADDDFLHAAVLEKTYELQKNIDIYGLGEINDGGEFRKATSEEITAAKDYIVAFAEWLGEVEMNISVNFDNEFEFKVAGYFEDVVYNSAGKAFKQSGVYFSQNFIEDNLLAVSSKGTSFTKYVTEADAVFDGACVEYDGTENTARDILTSVGRENRDENDVYYTINSKLYNTVEIANDIAAQLSLVFLIAGLVFAVFSALLMFNFISMSIANKRKEIGILRAVGARGLDVFKIFFAESGIIVAICTILSVVGTAILCTVLNNIIVHQLGTGIALFVFGAVSVLIMLGIAVLVAFVSTFLPVYFASRKKPVDSIRAL